MTDQPNIFVIIGAAISFLGILIFAFGKKFFLLRLFFKDRSTFKQLGWGLLIFLIGFIILLSTGVFIQ